MTQIWSKSLEFCSTETKKWPTVEWPGAGHGFSKILDRETEAQIRGMTYPGSQKEQSQRQWPEPSSLESLMIKKIWQASIQTMAHKMTKEMEALWLPTWIQVRIYLCYVTQRLTIKGKAKPEFHYDNADDCVNFSIGFSLQRDFPLGNQMVPLISQFSENKPHQSDSNVYGA